MGWLEDFVEHTSYGEAPEKVMYWVGVSTIAGALRRKVWIDEFNFQWTPNFYILLIGPPGVLKKSTSSNLGMRILKRLDGIDFGPQSTSWEQLVVHMDASRQVYKIGGKDFEASCVTIELSEFGTLCDPTNRGLVDALTDLWDAKLGTFAKETKTSGNNEILNPWLNIIAGVAPKWMDDNFSTKLIGSGFASRILYVYGDETKRIAHPSRHMPSESRMAENEWQLTERLKKIGELSGPYKLTEEAYQWSEKWYDRFRDFLEKECTNEEMGLHSRKQAHLMKTAMVISASKGMFPVIGVDELMEADQALASIQGDMNRVFGYVGQSPTSKLARDIVEVLQREGEQSRKTMYRKHFFRVVGIQAFDEALKSVKESGLIREVGNLSDPILRVV